MRQGQCQPGVRRPGRSCGPRSGKAHGKRHWLCHRPAPERRGPARGHGPWHRMPALRRPHACARAGIGPGPDKRRASRPAAENGRGRRSIDDRVARRRRERRRPALCLFDERWHPGVIGLVASRIKDKSHRPTIAFAPAAPGSDSLRGSSRSIPGFHIRDAIAAVDAQHPGLIERFGGHAMAAGLSLSSANLATFRRLVHGLRASDVDAGTTELRTSQRRTTFSVRVHSRDS